MKHSKLFQKLLVIITTGGFVVVTNTFLQFLTNSK